MAARIEELVTMLYDAINDAWSLPFGGGKCLVDKEEALGLIDEIRENLPRDLEQARIIVEGRNDILTQAKREGESIKRAAEERARQLVSEDEILITAKQKANEMVTLAETKSKELSRTANEYVEDSLRRLEQVMEQALGETRRARDDFKKIAK